MTEANENQTSKNSTDSLDSLVSLALKRAPFFTVHALLLDCVIETQLAQSPLRWWVSAVVVIYFAFLAVVYRRVGRSDAVNLLGPGTLIGTVALVALVCCSSLHPAGMSDGVRLLGMTTSTVQIAVTMIGIGLFGALSYLSVQIDHRLRIAVGAIVIYGLFSFLLGLLNGASYVELLQGDAFWAALPLLLQGSVLGALVMLPIALIHQVARRIMSDQRLALQAWSARTICGALCFLLAIQGFSYGPGRIVPTGVAQAAEYLPALDQGPVISQASQTDASAQEVVEKFDEAIALLAQSSALFEAVPLSPEEVIERVGNNPLDLYHWVRDNTAFVVYRGVLRGPEGVLADRDGNALDRSMLLQRLLTLAGHRSRLASGTLDQEIAARIATNSEQSASRIPFSSLEISDTQLNEARNRVTTQSEQIMQLLEHTPAGVRDMDDVVAEVADHWWVQMHDGKNWLDLDTLAEGPQKSLTAATANFTEETLPKDLFQQVSVRLLLETRGQDSDHHVLAEISRPAHSLAGKTIHVGHLPLGIDSMESVTSVEAVLDIMAGTGAWLPLLSFDGTSTRGSLITPSGKIMEPTDGNIRRFTDVATRISEDLLSRLNESNMGKTRATQPSAPYEALVSEWIEIQVSIPGGERNIIRRVLFEDNETLRKAELAQAEAERVRAEADRVRAEADRVRAEAERVYSLWEEEQAELNNKRQVCSEQSGKDLEDLWVLEKDALPDWPEMEDMELLTELYGYDKCMDLSMALTYASTEPTKVPARDQALSDEPDSPKRAEELAVPRAVQPAHHRKVTGLLRGTHIASETAKLSGAALTRRLENKLSRLTELRTLIESEGDQLPELRIKKFIPVLRTLQTELDYLAYLRWKTHPGGDDLFMSQPGITLLDQSIVDLGQNGWVSMQSIDIAVNRVEVRPGSEDSPFNTRLAQGVADTLSEAMIHPTSDLPINMSLIHDLAVGHGIGFKRLSPGSKGEVEALDMSKVAKDRLMQDLLAGHDVVVPNQLIDFGTGYASWWRIDTVTGNTLGMISNGAGGASAVLPFSTVIETVIYLAIMLDIYFFADCVTGGQNEVFFFASIEDADLGKRFALCTLEWAVMNAMFKTLFKMLSRQHGSIKSLLTDESKALNHRVFPWDHPQGVPYDEARHVGMHADQIDVLEKVAEGHDAFIILRASNPESLKYHGMTGYVSKPVDVKFKTHPDDGLVHVPGEPMSADDMKHLEDLLGREPPWSVDEAGLLRDPSGNKIYGDHDLMGLFDANGKRIWDENWADVMNYTVFRDSGDMFRHGANDDYLVGFGRFPGRYPEPNEIYVIMDPRSKATRIIEGTENLKEFYHNNRLPWIYNRLP